MKAIIVFLSFLCCSPLFSQKLSKRGFIKAFQEADVVFEYGEDYQEAARQYESLAKIYPDNANLSAKLGICYLNIDGKSADALKLLQKASSNIVSNEKEYKQYGEKASLDTYLYLAVAYHKNDSLQKAISLYNDAKTRLQGTSLAQEEYIDNQIRDCKYAMEMMKQPLTMITSLIAPWLKEYPGSCNPVISKNDSVFIFTQKKDGKTRILCSYKLTDWNRPSDITKQLGGYDRFYSNSITGDGRMLIIFMDDGGDGNLYYSLRTDTTWSKIKRVGRYVNTIYWESNGFITPDGKTLYFSSNRPGGEGELDIWVSDKDDDGTWKHPVNLGNIINTPYNEDTPFYDPSTSSLLFSSTGHISIGGYDLFRSTNRNGIWTTPIGLPYSFNNTADNTFFILNNDAPGFITSLYNKKDSVRNIYSIVAESPVDKIILTQGGIKLEDGMTIDPKKIKINLSDLKNVAKIKNISMIDTGSYKFEVKPGDYQLIISYPGYKTDTININIPLYFSANYISLNSSLVPDKVIAGDFLSIKNIFFDFDSSRLNDIAKSELQTLKSILENHPELNIEVAGFTDAKGSVEYNKRLSDRRAQAVIDYLSSSGIAVSRLQKKAYGKSGFIGPNVNPDGSDNPEGRSMNRRVTFGIVDPKTGVIISQETFTPKHLGQSYSIKYSIILLKGKDNLPSDYFNNLKITGINIIRTVKIDSVSLYLIGAFNNKGDAIKYLDYVKKNGFKDAYIVDQYEVNNASKSLISPETESTGLGDKVYTIQLIATKTPIDLDKFKGINGIKEIASGDGYYRYTCGKYTSLTDAKAAVVLYKNSGYKDAFVRELNMPGSNK